MIRGQDGLNDWQNCTLPEQNPLSRPLARDSGFLVEQT